MNDFPAADLRSNLATWAVPGALAPAVTRALLECYPSEYFDPDFRGQRLETTYFDTPGFRLRKARRNKGRYLTLRIRCYRPAHTYALSGKTEGQKFRVLLPEAEAESYLKNGLDSDGAARRLPADMLARLLDLAGDDFLGPCVTVFAHRYAVEDDRDRLTFDQGVATDTGKVLPGNVLEFKSTRDDSLPPAALTSLGLRPIKLSKFLWATHY